jgi:hypothetical protein
MATAKLASCGIKSRTAWAAACSTLKNRSDAVRSIQRVDIALRGEYREP